jgi:hypothetical protein
MVSCWHRPKGEAVKVKQKRKMKINLADMYDNATLDRLARLDKVRWAAYDKVLSTWDVENDGPSYDAQFNLLWENEFHKMCKRAASKARWYQTNNKKGK